MKRLFPLLLLFVFASSLEAQQSRTEFDLSDFGVEIKADKRLIAVRTALEIAGIQTELTSEGEAFRKEVLKDFAELNPDLRDKLRIFVDQYRKRHKGLTHAELASPFVSMAFTLSPAPEFEEPERSIDLPGSLLEVLDFSPLVRELYRANGANSKIDTYYQQYGDEVTGLLPSARVMIRDVLDYLHTRPRLSYIDRVRVESGDGNKKIYKYEPVERFRTFTIVPDYLASKGNVNFLNIRDEYIAIIPPQTEISSSEVRRAYLQFVLDPLVLKEARGILLQSEAIKALLSSEGIRKTAAINDPVLTVSRSLVAAVDIREEQYRKEQLATDQARRTIVLMKTEEEKREVTSKLGLLKAEFADEAILRLSESYERGAVFSFYFAEKLLGVEQSGFDIGGSLPVWISMLEPKKESSRIAENLVASQRGILARERRKGENGVTLPINPLTRELLKVDKSVSAKKFVDAETRLRELLDEYSDNVIETSRIFYSLGRLNSIVAENTADPEEVGLILEQAAIHYKSVLRLASPNDRALISSAYFALGRIYEHFDQNDYALKIYDAALQIGKVNGGAFNEAFEAKKSLLAKKSN